MFVLVANTAEAFGASLKKVAHTAEGARRIRHELTLSQRAVFWGGGDKCVITPYPIPLALLEHSARACGYEGVSNLSPREPTINLSKAMAGEKALRNEVIACARRAPIVLSPYATTPDFWQMVRVFERKKVAVRTQGVPAQASLWTARYLNSKLGCRLEIQSLMARHDFLRMPEGFVAQTVAEVMDVLAWFHANGRPAVVKANFGESGWGLWICRIQGRASSAGAQTALKRALDSDPTWKGAPFIVEELVETDSTVCRGSPSVELFIGDDGPVITYHCGQVVDAAGEFIGVEIGKDVVPSMVKTAMEQMAIVVAERYYALGYQGYFDIDFVVGKDGHLYVVETNPRRTGGTHVYDLAKQLFGDTWEDHVYLLSHDSLRYGTRTLGAEEMLERTRQLRYPINGTRSGIVITSLNAWDPIMGYVAIGDDAHEGRDLQKRLLNLFELNPSHLPG